MSILYLRTLYMFTHPGLSSQPAQSLLAFLCATDGLRLPKSFAGVHFPTVLPLMPGLHALASE